MPAAACSATPRRCSMAVAASGPHAPTELPVEPSLDEVRELAREHNLVALRHSFIDDLETPVSAFLKLRGRDPQFPAFLLESAEQGQRVGRFSFIGVRPRKVVRWSLGDGGDPYALAAVEIGSVLVTTTSWAGQFLSRSTAGSERMAWLAAITTAAAPSAMSASAALVMVLPVSIMSSTRMQVRPVTSPTTRLATVSLGRSMLRVLWMKASGTPPSRADQRSATLIRPASGETTASSWSP